MASNSSIPLQKANDIGKRIQGSKMMVTEGRGQSSKLVSTDNRFSPLLEDKEESVRQDKPPEGGKIPLTL